MPAILGDLKIIPAFLHRANCPARGIAGAHDQQAAGFEHALTFVEERPRFP